jgi:putative heme-binding domain-containing protein
VKSPESNAFLHDLVDQLAAGRLAQELALDTIDATEQTNDPSLRDALKRLPQTSGKPAVDRLRYVLVGGNANAGREVFRNHVGAQCIRCHDAGGEGKQAGPILAGIGNRTTRAELLESLLDPSAKLADGFAQTTVYLHDGDTLDGVRLAESKDSLTLRLITGEQRVIARKDIEKSAANPVSPMPPMGDVLSPAQLRDLIEFLATWK